jgi:hypothetical protein
LSDAQGVACGEAAKIMLRILQESETNDFDSIATSDESWFQHTTASLKMFAGSAADVFPRTPQAVGAKNYDHGVLHRNETYEFDDIPRGSIFNQLYFINNRFPDLKTTNMNFQRQKTESTFGCTWIIPCAMRIEGYVKN